MLGKEISHAVGSQTGTRVLSHPEHGTTVEVSFQADGTLLGVHATDMGTYDSWLEPDGSLRGRGQGVTAGEQGEMATWEGTGVGHRREEGATSFRGILLFRSQTPQWSQLNGTCCVFEFEVDGGGKTDARLWTWE